MHVSKCGQGEDCQIKSDFSEFCQQYESDFSNIHMLSSELVMWETFRKEKFDKELLNSIAKTLRLTDSVKFPNI